MDAEARPLNPLLQQWLALPFGDRKGVLRRLDVGQRLTLQRLLDTAKRENAHLAAQVQRFSGCSPWLSELLDACEKNAPAAAYLKPAVRAALLAGHEEAAGSRDAPVPISLAALAKSWIKAVKDRL